ncbi:amino-acid N-acetyltransferase [Dyadobacter sp. BE34]|jgi:amino-acid N-acetyltransferase|uniref:Amino-acid N-acetyltransferase n=1 Tax=Dyadobacter fermentans TaxID=94254 RepID=A0ABU1R8F5_9BACT|nr:MULTISPECIES: arsenic resistance N-acetyltransferase ArsN2 [Dyadobacter]MDR6809693.1 amino-acid N-acetyltransferase [Dyadobacter fermentans]MDR7047485.1 amino-acid N-acetyltransferase [Dyadobacter sp. BE242]MDR7201655.1 amino-acid N-acetyltransferase [Dyadobacter sp. BE34]MDR7219525.1 amino-acid N-acetyltransferase [Dyadobacter sp. BE31]MDR7267293.1 amino-acid N-acetyltransferase [Dyadobacter sp. BE32]
MKLQIDKAGPADRELVTSLLKEADLLTDDLPTGLEHFILARNEGALVGVAGMELFEQVGLLRSIAVSPDHQGKGIARKLVEQLLANADKQEIEAVYLITTTADHYFDRYGFVVVNREQVPEAIQQTRQFSGLCPTSAVVMKRDLTHTTA